jgi:orotidine-5'-phosphate decarboxylase
MLEAAAGARHGRILLAGVGVLTSLDAAEYGAILGRPVADLSQEQQRLVRLGVAVGLDGYVAAAGEARAVRTLAGSDARIVVPGVRRATDAAADQVRTATPRQAAEAGADYLVVGRPVTRAADPAAEARALVEELRP